MSNALLIQALAHSSPTTSQTAAIRPLDPERRKFLEAAIADMTYSIPVKMKEHIQIIQDSSSSTAKIIAALDDLQYECEQIDAAIDLYKLKGTQPVLAMCSHEDFEIRTRAAWVLATCINHNPTVVDQIRPLNLMEKFLNWMIAEEEPEAAQKFLLCVSYLAREDVSHIKEYRNLGLFTKLGVMCKNQCQKVRRKSMFAIFAITQQLERSEVEEIVCEEGFLTNMVEALLNFEDSSQCDIAFDFLNILAIVVPPSSSVLVAAKKAGLAEALPKIRNILEPGESSSSLLKDIWPKLNDLLCCK